MKKTYLSSIAAAFLVATSAHASTITGIFDVTPAVSSSTTKTHSLWFAEDLPGLSNRFTLTSPGTFTANSNGATLTGSTVSLINEQPDAAAGLDMSFVFDRDFSDLADPNIVFKDVFGNSGPHGNEDYFDLERGTISGTGTLAGLEITVSRKPVNGTNGTQVGGGLTSQVGANQHNSNFGLAAWFMVDSVDTAGCAGCDQNAFQSLVGKQGDINFDLTFVAPVPLPAAGFLLLGALASVAGARARKKKA